MKLRSLILTLSLLLSTLLLSGCVALPPAVIAAETAYIAIEKYTDIADPIILKACVVFRDLRVQVNTKIAASPPTPARFSIISWLATAGDAFCANPPSNGDPLGMVIWLIQVGGMLISEASQTDENATTPAMQYQFNDNYLNRSLNGK
jgi:hypothetical protein